MTTDAGTPRTNPVYARRTVVELERSLTAAEAERDALLRFKRFVHSFLTQRGVPEDPPGKHRDEGCRVGQRLQYVCDERDALRARVAGLEAGLRYSSDLLTEASAPYIAASIDDIKWCEHRDATVADACALLAPSSSEVKP